MFRGRKSDTLPTASYNSYSEYNNIGSPSNSSSRSSSVYGYGSSRKVPDGSGRGIRMEAPIVRAWRNSSVFTKATYYSAFLTVAVLVWGVHDLRSSNASIWLTCHAMECTLEISPPRRRKSLKFTFSRRQLVKSQAIKVDKYNNFVEIDTGRPSRHFSHKKGQKYKPAGPDADGNYDSYTIHLRPPMQSQDPNDSAAAHLEVELNMIEPFTSKDEDSENRVLNMRRFNIGQTRRRTSTMTNKLDSYIQQRRHQLVIKENAALSFKGIFALILGLFGILLTALVGQWYDEDPKTGGPGARKKLQHRKTLKPPNGRKRF